MLVKIQASRCMGLPSVLFLAGFSLTRLLYCACNNNYFQCTLGQSGPVTVQVLKKAVNIPILDIKTSMFTSSLELRNGCSCCMYLC